MSAIDPVTFPAAAVPERTKRRFRAGAGVVVVLLIVVPQTASDLGTALLLAGVILLFVAPALWHLGMFPDSYSIDAKTITVHRRHLPDSRFPVVGPVRLGQADATKPAPAPGPVYGEEPRPIQRMTTRRIYKALTDTRCAVRVPIKAGTLMISPDDPDEFVRTAEVLR